MGCLAQTGRASGGLSGKARSAPVTGGNVRPLAFVAFKNKSKKQELLAHSLNAYIANLMVRKAPKTWKNTARTCLQSLFRPAASWFGVVFQVFRPAFKEKICIFLMWKKRKALTFFALIFEG
jgi:hypothetical protein